MIVTSLMEVDRPCAVAGAGARGGCSNSLLVDERDTRGQLPCRVRLLRRPLWDQILC